MYKELVYTDYRLTVANKMLIDYKGTSTDKVVVPDGITNITQGALLDCSAKSIILPNSLTEIAEFAFSNCSNLTRISIPANVHTIGEEAFSMCDNLEEIYIGKNVRTVNFYQIAKQKKFKRFVIDPANPYYKVVDGIVYSKDDKKLVYFPKERKGDYRVSSQIEEIGSYAFCRSNLTHIYLTDSIKKLGDFCFAGMTNLKQVSTCSANGECKPTAYDICLPRSLTEIPVSCFQGCKKIDKVLLPPSIKKIKECAFSISNISMIDFPEALKEIEECAFRECTSLKKVELPDRLEILGHKVFHGSALREVILPSHLRKISGDSFSGCSHLKKMAFRSENPNFVIDDLVIFSRDKSTLVAYCNPKDQVYFVPATVKKIADYAFCYTPIEFVWLPKGLLSIGDCAFKGSKLESIELPDGFRHLGENAFLNTNIQKGLYFPESLVSATPSQDQYPITGPNETNCLKYVRLLKKFKKMGYPVSCQALTRQEKTDKLIEIAFKTHLEEALTQRGITYQFDNRTHKNRISLILNGDFRLHTPNNLKPAFFKVRPCLDPKKFERQVNRICRHTEGRCLVLKLKGL